MTFIITYTDEGSNCKIRVGGLPGDAFNGGGMSQVWFPLRKSENKRFFINRIIYNYCLNVILMRLLARNYPGTFYFCVI